MGVKTLRSLVSFVVAGGTGSESTNTRVDESWSETDGGIGGGLEWQGVGRGGGNGVSLAANSVTKAAERRQSQQGTLGFLFFPLAAIHRGSAKSPASSPYG